MGRKRSRAEIAAIARKGKFPRSTDVQTVIIAKKLGLSKSRATMAVKNAGFKASKVDVKPNSFRFRQRPPSDFIRKTFRTKTIKPGLKIVIGIPK